MNPNHNNKLDLLWQFTRSSFKMRYQNSLLGFLWVLIKPYSTFGVLYVFWSQREGGGVESYGIYLLLGIVFYTFFNELMVYGNMALLDKAHIILKVNFSRQIAIISSLISAIINLGINLVLVFVIMMLTSTPIWAGGVMYMLLVTLVIFGFGTGIALFTSVINVRFRDLKNIFELGLFLLYWISAVVFVPENFEGAPRMLMEINPVAFMLNQIRAGFGIYGEVNLPAVLLIGVAVLLLNVLGWRFFAKHIKQIAEYF